MTTAVPAPNSADDFVVVCHTHQGILESVAVFRGRDLDFNAYLSEMNDPPEGMVVSFWPVAVFSDLGRSSGRKQYLRLPDRWVEAP